MAKKHLSAYLLLISATFQIQADENMGAENFFESLKGFCSSEKAWHAEYEGLIKPKVKGHPWFNTEITGTLEMFFQCPRQLKIQLQTSTFHYQLITDGVQAWVLHKLIGKENFYVEQYNSLEKRELGLWMDSLMNSLKEKNKAHLSQKLNLTKKNDGTKSSYQLGIEKTKDNFELQMESFPKFKIQGFHWVNENADAKFQLKRVLDVKEALDPKTYYYFQKTGDKVKIFAE